MIGPQSSGTARGHTRLNRSERALYHQIHPAKLAADAAGALVSTVLLWRGRLFLSLAAR